MRDCTKLRVFILADELAVMIYIVTRDFLRCNDSYYVLPTQNPYPMTHTLQPTAYSLTF